MSYQFVDSSYASKVHKCEPYFVSHPDSDLNENREEDKVDGTDYVSTDAARETNNSECDPIQAYVHTDAAIQIKSASVKEDVEETIGSPNFDSVIGSEEEKYATNIEDPLMVGDKYKCPMCEYTTTRLSSLRGHDKSAHVKPDQFQPPEKHRKKRKSKVLKKKNKFSPNKRMITIGEKRTKKEHTHFCPQCEYSTTRSTYLLSHIDKIHRKLKPHQCSQCKYSTACHSNLKTHINTVHMKIKRYQCAECEYSAYGAVLLKRHCESVHMKLKPYACPECDYTASSTFHLKRHVVSIHMKLRPYSCPKCVDTFTRHAYLRKHYESVHNESLPSSVVDPNKSILQNVEVNPTLSKRSKLLVTSTKKLKGKKNLFRVKRHQCTECEYAADKASVLGYHVKAVHMKIKNHQCPECPYKTFDNSNLKTHINAVHKKVKRYQCAQCEYTTYGATILRRHINSKHDKLKPHNCPQCSYCAASASHIKRHILRKHTNVEATRTSPPKKLSPSMATAYNFSNSVVPNNENTNVMMESAMNLSNHHSVSHANHIAHMNSISHGNHIPHSNSIVHGIPISHSNSISHMSHISHVNPLSHVNALSHTNSLSHPNSLSHIHPLSHVNHLSHVNPLSHANPLSHVNSISHINPADGYMVPNIPNALNLTHNSYMEMQAQQIFHL